MSINRLSRIVGHRIFRDFSWPSALNDFKRFNLIYGWNGTGKSTLCRLLRHIEKRTIVSEGTVTFRIDNHDVAGDSLASTTQHLRVFNNDFIAENVFTATHRLAPIYVIGKENIDKQVQLDSLREKLVVTESQLTQDDQALRRATKARDDFCISQAKSVKDALGAHGNVYAGYNKRAFRTRIDDLIASHSPDLTPLSDSDKERLLAQARMSPKPRIQADIYESPDLSALQDQVSKLLQRRVVSKVIQSLKDNPTLAKWVHDGIALHPAPATDCLFCNQPLPAERLSQLEAHFSREFATLIADIDALAATFDESINAAKSATFPKKAEFYDDLTADYATHEQQALRACNDIATYLGKLNEALTRKRAAPFDDQGTAPSPPTIDLSPITAIQSVITSHNDVCEQFDNRISSALQRLETGYVVAAHSDYSVLATTEASAQSTLDATRTKQQELRQTIAELERDIISHREPADELNRELRAYLGHADLQCEVKDTGYIITRKGEVATALSEGERTAIAVLYFLKSLTGRDFDKSRGCVIIDDPVSSLDANALFNAFAYIKDHTRDVQQIVLLTHNYGFFRAVREWFRNLRGQARREWHIYMLRTHVDEDGRFAELVDIDPLLRDYESEYHYLFSYVYRICQEPAAVNLESYLPAPTVARRVLESFLAFRVPNEDSLHSRMQAIQCEDTLRSRIYRFVNTHSHKDGIGDHGDDLSILSETKAVLQSLCDFMKAGDPEHFDRMVECVTRVAPPQPAAP